ncbi:MAG: electron transfer flavoprotein subunit beta/FixA family protein [Paenibacillaceae bacterium]
MNILVFIRQTFDTEERIVIDNGRIAEDGVKFVINPYDEYAVEEAIKLKESHDAEVTVVSVGPVRTVDALRTALAMGADKAVLVETDDILSDERLVSKVLAEVIRKEQADLILGGYMTVDFGSTQLGPRLAEELDLPHISAITKLTLDGTQVIVERDAEGDVEIIECSLPVLLTAQQGLNDPRYPSLPGIMKAKKKPLERLTFSDLGMDPSQLKSNIEILQQFLPPKREAGRILEGEMPDRVKELMNLLHNKEKVL